MEGEETAEEEMRNNVTFKSKVDMNVEGENHESTLEYDNANMIVASEFMDVTSIKEEADELKVYNIKDAETDPLNFDNTVEVKTEIKVEEELLITDGMAMTSDIIKSHSRNLCSFTGCGRSKARYPRLHFFSFPVRRPSICDAWIKNCANEALEKTTKKTLNKRVVCEKHFEDSCFISTMKTKLNTRAVPTILSLQDIDNASGTVSEHDANDAETDPLNFDDTLEVKTEIKIEEELLITDGMATTPDFIKKHSRNLCSFTGCGRSKARYPRLRFFSFPVKRPSICDAWIKNCANKALEKASKKTLNKRVVCEKHFEDSCFTSTMKTKLNVRAVPSILSPQDVDNASGTVSEHDANDAETDPLNFDDTLEVKTEIKIEEELLITDIPDISHEELSNKGLEIKDEITSPLDQDGLTPHVMVSVCREKKKKSFTRVQPTIVVGKRENTMELKKIKYKVKYCKEDKHFLCPLCVFRTSEVTKMKLHLVEHTKVKFHTCEMCSKGYETVASLDLHKLKHCDYFFCQICGFEHRFYSHVKSHMLAEHGAKTRYWLYHAKPSPGNRRVRVQTSKFTRLT